MKQPYLVWQRGFHAATGSTIHANDIHEAVNLWAAEFDKQVEYDGAASGKCWPPIALGNQIEVYAIWTHGEDPETLLADLAADVKLFIAAGEMVPVYRARLVVQP